MKANLSILFALGFLYTEVQAQSTAPRLEWERYIGTEQWDVANDIIALKTGGFLVVGYTYTEETKSDFWVSKLDITGKTIWEKSFGGRLRDVAKSVTVAEDGGYVIVGSTQSKGAGNKDVWVVKIDEEGNDS